MGGTARATVSDLDRTAHNVLVEHKSIKCPTLIVVVFYKKEGTSARTPSGQFLTKHPLSPPSSPEEEAPSSLEVEEHPSSTPMSHAAATPEKIDDIADLNIVEDLDNQPSNKSKIAESGVLEPSPMSPSILASTPISECFESIVLESDNKIDRDPLPSPPSPSSSTLSPVFPLHDVKEPDSNKEIKVDETYMFFEADDSWTDQQLGREHPSRGETN
ncbi:hypothetical protein ACQJBY_015472 [Aegilops geniculata]